MCVAKIVFIRYPPDFNNTTVCFLLTLCSTEVQTLESRLVAR